MKLLSSDYRAVEVEKIQVSSGKKVISGTRSGHFGYFVLKGNLSITSQISSSTLRKGELGWIGGGHERSVTCSRGAAWIVIRVRNRCFAPVNVADAIAWETLLNLSALGRQQPRVPLKHTTCRELLELLNKLLTWMNNDRLDSITMRKALLLQFLMIVRTDERFRPACLGLTEEASAPDLLHDVLLLLDREAAHIRDAVDLARRAGMSRSALYRLFHSAGFPAPSAMLEQARMEHAVRLLQESRSPVLDIAMESGFGSLSAFYRCFQRIHKLSPGQWRRQQLG